MTSTYAQKKKGSKARISAGSAKGTKINGESYTLFNSKNGKRVKIKQGTSTIWCDRARQHRKTNEVVAWGNIIIIDKTTKITGGDRLDYDQEDDEVIITGDEVVLLDGDSKLVTDKLYYYAETKTAKYLTGGTIYDLEKNQTLKSREGFLKGDVMEFYYDVEMDDEEKDEHLRTEKLIYNKVTELASFDTETFILSPDGKVAATEGTYNAADGKVNFTSSALIENEDYILSGDHIISNKETAESYADGDVIFFSKKDSVIIYADYLENVDNQTLAYGDALMSKPVDGDWNNMFYLAADTLFSEEDTLAEERTMHAYHKVKFTSEDMQGKCDSLVYYMTDSLMYFFTDPIIWAQESQMTAEVIHTRMKDGGMDQMVLNKKAFVIQADSMGNYNQTSGKVITSYLDGQRMEKIDIKGNGTILYYAYDQETGNLDGLNRSACPDMSVFFNDENKLQYVSHNTKHNSVFLNPSSIRKPDRFLPGYDNRFDEIPEKKDIVDRVRVRKELDTDKGKEPQINIKFPMQEEKKPMLDAPIPIDLEINTALDNR